MINIFTICYNVAKKSYRKVNDFFSPDSADVRNPNNSADTNEITNIPKTKSIWQTILAFVKNDNSTLNKNKDDNSTLIDKNKDDNSTSNTKKLELKILTQDEAIEQLSDAINKYKNKEIKKEIRHRLITKALDDLESIPNEILSDKLPEECIDHFISVGLPADKTELVTPYIFRSLLKTIGSSVRSVLYTLRKADTSELKVYPTDPTDDPTDGPTDDPTEATINLLTKFYAHELLKTNMPYATFDSNKKPHYRVPANEAKEIKADNTEYQIRAERMRNDAYNNNELTKFEDYLWFGRILEFHASTSARLIDFHTTENGRVYYFREDGYIADADDE